jgi:DNA-binding CsgD family transcriptional regulator
MVLKIFRVAIAIFILWISTIFPHLIRTYMFFYILSIGSYVFALCSKKFGDFLILASILILFFVSITIIRNNHAAICAGSLSVVSGGLVGYNLCNIKSSETNTELKKEVFFTRLFHCKLFENAIDLDTIDLTNSETCVLKYLCIYGYSNKELASLLGKSESTIKSQLKSIMDKSGLDSRFELIESFKINFF